MRPITYTWRIEWFSEHRIFGNNAEDESHYLSESIRFCRNEQRGIHYQQQSQLSPQIVNYLIASANFWTRMAYYYLCARITTSPAVWRSNGNWVKVIYMCAWNIYIILYLCASVCPATHHTAEHYLIEYKRHRWDSQTLWPRVLLTIHCIRNINLLASSDDSE